MGVKLRKKCLLVLRKLCGLCGSLPSSHMIQEGLQKTDDYAFTSGGFADVYRGTYKGQKVAIKAFRIYAQGDLMQVRKVTLFLLRLTGTPDVPTSAFVKRLLSGNASHIQTFCRFGVHRPTCFNSVWSVNGWITVQSAST